MFVSLETHETRSLQYQEMGVVVSKDKRMFLRVRPSVLAEIRDYGERNDRMTARSVILAGLAELGISIPDGCIKGVRKMRSNAPDQLTEAERDWVPFSVLLPESVWRDLSLLAAKRMVQKRAIIFDGLIKLGLNISDEMQSEVSRLEKDSGSK